MEIFISQWVHENLPNTPFFIAFFRFFSFFGNTSTLLFIVSLFAIFFMFTARFNRAQILVMAGVLATLASRTLKFIVGRERPQLFEHLDIVGGKSFPSGHALVTFVVYGILAHFLAESFPNRKRLIYSLAGVFLFIIGFSRIYLGVHWTSDVLGGWLIGAVILTVMIWWYYRGGLVRLLRIIIGLVFLALGLVGIVFPVIPGILLIIAGFILIFSGKPLQKLISDLGDWISKGRSSVKDQNGKVQ